MTGLTYEGMDSLVWRLDRVRGRYLVVQTARAGAVLATVGAVGLLVAGVICGYWPGQPPVPLRWGLLIGVLASWAGALAFVGLEFFRRRLNHSQAARLVEQAVAGLDNGLINAVQLSRDGGQTPALVQQAIHETLRRTVRLAMPSAVSIRGLKRCALAAGASLAVLAGVALLQGERLARGLSAVFRPTSYARNLGSVRLVSLTPGDATVFAGEPVTVVAKVENPRGVRHEAVVEVLPPADRPEQGEARRTMIPSPDRTVYSCPLGKAEQSFRYVVRIGDSRWPQDRPAYTLTVLQRVQVEGLDLLYAYPPYTRLPERSVVNAPGPVEAPAGSAVTVTLRLSAAVPGAVLQRRGGQGLPMQADTSGKAFSAVIQVTADDAYRILLTDVSGRKLQQLPDISGEQEAREYPDGMYPISARPDAPPVIAFVEPRGDVTVAAGAKLIVRLKASDDYGVAAARLFLARGDGPPLTPDVKGPPAMVHEFARVNGLAPADLTYTLTVGPEYRNGDVMVCHGTATDERPAVLGGPQTTETVPRLKITVADPTVAAAEKARRFDELRARLLALLARQEAQRVATDMVWKKLSDLPAARSAGGDIARGQQTIRAETADLAENFPFEADMAALRAALTELAANDAAQAVAQATVLAGLGDLSERPGACQALAATQDRIIQALQWILAILPSLENPDAARRTAEGEDLPPEAVEKLLDLKAELEKFIDQQRKVLSATQDLAKGPADNFTRADEDLLKELRALQDKWEKFLNEQFVDFSKMAQQDFSRPTLLKELLSVKTDVTMAKDALSQKAAEIATAIEDNGIENAEALTANIEKWLPDSPDRIKWDMEDPTGQSSIEQAELPDELEDLVGDLLEEEEDLFDEMQDVTGKYAMSGDKGIGWDVMDGPISNMNAQGVTGNQLPNTSEISGRSGEGRQGKATGEFVEDKAVGKGGRRTPTRLTPEPFQQGQINDMSEESAGGATGGGKLSGAGSEGLEGPLPPELAEQMKRLAGRHAQLLNRAERIQTAMKVSDYSNYQFLQTVTLMNRVQDDLDRFRYVNVLRQKTVLLTGLRRAHDLLTGRIDVTADRSGSLPKAVRDDISDAMNSQLPAEYQEALKRYFLRLSQTGAAPPTTQPGGK